MIHHMPMGYAPAGGFFMMFLFVLLLVGLFWAFRRGRFGPPPWMRGPYPGTGDKPAEGAPHHQGWVGPWAQAPAPRPEDEALKVLADRLASGDITPDEYLERVSVLRQQH